MLRILIYLRRISFEKLQIVTVMKTGSRVRFGELINFAFDNNKTTK